MVDKERFVLLFASLAL